ncbi:hypothetical protein [Paractinoplanes tereljensis]|uniref:hypothetical protein n=2 Tax=Paractinoplanes tereljensis TaxID=571912 RepID=UPI003391E44A
MPLRRLQARITVLLPIALGVAVLLRIALLFALGVAVLLPITLLVALRVAVLLPITLRVALRVAVLLPITLRVALRVAARGLVAELGVGGVGLAAVDGGGTAALVRRGEAAGLGLAAVVLEVVGHGHRAVPRRLVALRRGLRATRARARAGTRRVTTGASVLRRALVVRARLVPLDGGV